MTEPVLTGRTLSHYRVLERIGSGGMGEVYRAYDERLERDVAIKVLPLGTLADDAARKRFRKEALALSKLNHPNIATVFDFDTQGGTDFIVMEHVAGETLGEVLSGGPLPEREISRLGEQLAEGLAAAHGQGIVHRDLKPGNVRLTVDRRLKILDFGLAKLVGRSGAIPEGQTKTASITEVGIGAGTLPYMAPEQLRGEPVDARSDLWAAGHVLYEMATARRAFSGPDDARLIAAILQEPVSPAGGVNRGVSPALEGIIAKCLEKDPERRYQSAKELATDLRRLGSPPSLGKVIRGRRARLRRWITAAAAGSAVALLTVVLIVRGGGLRHGLPGGAGAGSIRSLAVLPFTNLSGDPQQEYFADGMTDELITSLAQIAALRVISRTSVMQYKGTHKKLPAIARELGVQAVVEGSVARQGERVRITAQLIEASNDRHLWASSFEREAKDVLFLRGDLSQAITGAIRAVLTPEERTRLGNVRPVNSNAYEAYLRGRSHGAKFTAQEMSNAIDYLQEAVARQPDYALAYAEMARDYWYLGQPLGGMHYREAMEKARAAAAKAMDLDPTLGEAYSALGAVRLWYEWDSADAEKLFKRALELTPGDAFTHFQYGFFLVATGRPEAAITEGRRAVEISPLELTVRVALAEVLFFARRYDDSIQECRKMIALDPAFPRAYVDLSWDYQATGRYDSAGAAVADWWKLQSNSKHAEEIRRAAASGREGYLRCLLVQFGRGAGTLAQLGEIDEAIAALEHGYSVRGGDMIFLEVIPFLDPLRSNRRFQDLVRRVGIRPQGSAEIGGPG
jgi:eukaryotic-like serine/threonine-protein kinase